MAAANEAIIPNTGANDELWILKLKDYNRNLFALVYEFYPENLDTEFSRSDSDVEVVLSLINGLRNRNTETN